MRALWPETECSVTKFLYLHPNLTRTFAPSLGGLCRSAPPGPHSEIFQPARHTWPSCLLFYLLLTTYNETTPAR
jgi:hypothetical protein